MRKTLFFIFLIIGLLGIIVVLSRDSAVVVHPKGTIAKQELKLIITNILLMLAIILPTFLCLCIVVWKYCLKKGKSIYDPEHSASPWGIFFIWAAPAFIVIIMGYITWEATYRLNPYKPLESDLKPLKIQVVALDWKWLFIYPDQNIAVLNALYIPAKTPIHFQLTADQSPMNSFWIPQLSGQIYSMTGMSTTLHLMADEPGEYIGRAVEINGEGYADMHFPVFAIEKFDEWVQEVERSPLHLTDEFYEQLRRPFIDKKVQFFSHVEKNFYRKIIDKYMFPAKPVL